MSVKDASTDHPVQPLIVQRWSPYAYDEKRDVADEDLLALFEAARWAPSSYNEQPWRYLVARRSDTEAFAQVLSCLVEANQAWAKRASVLALGVIQRAFARNGKPNKAAEHDLGLAAGNLLAEATARGLKVHQMIGIDPERAREVFGIPEGAEAFTGIAIGHPTQSAEVPENLRKADQNPRQRRPLSETVFTGRFGRPAPFLD